MDYSEMDDWSDDEAYKVCEMADIEKGWWKMKDGRLIDVRKMDRRHLYNSINLTKRKLGELGVVAHSVNLEDGIEDDTEVEICRAKLGMLEDEKERRKKESKKDKKKKK